MKVDGLPITWVVDGLKGLEKIPQQYWEYFTNLPVILGKILELGSSPIQTAMMANLKKKKKSLLVGYFRTKKGKQTNNTK